MAILKSWGCYSAKFCTICVTEVEGKYKASFTLFVDDILPDKLEQATAITIISWKEYDSFTSCALDSYAFATYALANETNHIVTCFNMQGQQTASLDAREYLDATREYEKLKAEPNFYMQ